jgi:hypothetical protein
MKAKHAIALYLAMVLIAILASWLLAYFVAWWAGMGVLTVILADHMRYTVKQLLKRV